MVTLPWNFGHEIRDAINTYRRENNIPEPDKVKVLGTHNKIDHFFEEEFELVHEISIDKNSIKYIGLFPNIKSLTIDGEEQLDSEQIADIIEKYPNLEILKIKGQENLTYLDISNLSQLKQIDIISNRRLSRITGIDKIDNLEQLTFYDNIVYKKEEELCEAASKLSQSGTQCNLDVLYMPIMKQMGIPYSETFNWLESVGLGIKGDELKYETKELEEAVKKAQKIVSQYIKPTDATIQKYAILYQWMCENIKYDHEALENGHVHTEQGKNVGRLGGTNGTINGLVYGSCVCEGYSKSMQMLLQICGIPSFDVCCIAEDPKNITPSFNLSGKKKMHEGDHSILKINVDGKCYYSDITWDANRFQNGRERKYFLLSTRDITSDHKLVGEQHIFSASKSISSQEFQELMRFAQERIKNVNKELEEKAEMEKTPQEKLNDINKQLEQLSQQYGVVSKLIEELMTKNQQTPITNYQEQLSTLLAQREQVSKKMSSFIVPKRTLEEDIQRQKQFEHNRLISQVEELLSVRINSSARYEYDAKLKAPILIQKNQSELNQEEAYIKGKLIELRNNGDLNLKDFRDMTLAVVKQYTAMRKNAPKPQPQATQDNSTFTHQQEQNSTPIQPSQTSVDNREKKEEEKLREKYGYSDMSPEERDGFDSKIKSRITSTTGKRKESDPTEKFKLEEQRRELRRKQFEERARTMGLDLDQIVNLDNLFMQQEIIEQQALEETEELEEHRGMMM